MRKTMKQYLLLLAVIATAIACFAFSAGALDATGQCGDDVYWSYDSTSKELVISGKGAMYDYNNKTSYSPFRSNADITSVTIENGVTSIGNYAFNGNKQLNLVKIEGTTITKIGEYAFSSCDNLYNANVPTSVTSIKEFAFSSCANLKSITLPDKLTELGKRAFGGCYSLVCEIIIPDGVTTIEEGTFYNCNKVTKIVLPRNLTSIGDNAFTCCTVNELVFPKTLKTIGNYSFQFCKGISTITLPEGLTTIGIQAFYGCDGIEEVNFPNSLKSIGGSAFQSCSNLKKIKIPSGMSILEEYVFKQCASLEEVIIPKSVLVIEDHAFYGCKKITDVYYEGSKSDFDSIAFGTYNSYLTSANIHYNYKYSTVLGKPSSITTTQSTSAIKLTWSKVSGAAGYRVYQKNGTGWKTLYTGTGTSYTVSKLSAGTKYAFAVKAYANVDGKIIWSDTYTTINTATKTVKPYSVKSAQNTSAIKLSWNKCEGATGYRIYYKSGNKWKVTVKATTATSHTFKNLKSGAKFIFAIRPYIITDSGVVWSDYTTYTASTIPATITAKTSSTAKGKITLSWNAVNGADGYQVYYKVGNGSYKFYKVYSKAGTLNFSNLKSGTKYTFAVRAGIRTSGGNIYGGYKTSTVTVK